MKNFFLFLILFTACKAENQQDLTQNSPGELAQDSLNTLNSGLEEVEQVDNQGGNIEFVNDEMGGNPFTGDLPEILASIGKYDIFKKTFKNLHDSTAIDTLMTINFGTSAIEYFQGATTGFIITADIESDKVEFKRGIRIGMPEAEFNALFEELKDQENLQTVTISTMEGLAYTEFLFSKRTLTTIKYQSYFD